MKRKRFSEEQIIAILREAEAGVKIKDPRSGFQVCLSHQDHGFRAPGRRCSCFDNPETVIRFLGERAQCLQLPQIDET